MKFLLNLNFNDFVFEKIDSEYLLYVKLPNQGFELDNSHYPSFLHHKAVTHKLLILRCIRHYLL